MNLQSVLMAILTPLYCFATYSQQGMTLEEKVGQVLMVHFNGESANEAAQTLVQDTKVGGIIYYNWSNGLNSPEQVRTLSNGLQKFTNSNPHPIPLLIAVDQEGGRVMRLTNGFTKFPSNRDLASTLNPELAFDAARTMGKELKAVGVNMNLAPVVDVNNNPKNVIMGDRSFGNNVETVVAYAEKALAGYKEANVIATLKHYPGYGDVSVDPHEDLPIIHKTKEELEKVELAPFAQLAPLVDAIMTAHILVNALDPDNCSTLSKKTLDYLRESIGFNGLIISDSLVMQGVVKKCKTVDEAAIQALQAGCDMLILGGKLLSGEHAGFELTVTDIKRVHNSIVKAVQSGRLSEERINDAVERVLNLKNKI